MDLGKSCKRRSIKIGWDERESRPLSSACRKKRCGLIIPPETRAGTDRDNELRRGIVVRDKHDPIWKKGEILGFLAR